MTTTQNTSPAPFLSATVDIRIVNGREYVVTYVPPVPAADVRDDLGLAAGVVGFHNARGRDEHYRIALGDRAEN